MMEADGVELSELVGRKVILKEHPYGALDRQPFGSVGVVVEDQGAGWFVVRLSNNTVADYAIEYLKFVD